MAAILSRSRCVYGDHEAPLIKMVKNIWLMFVDTRAGSTIHNDKK